EGGAWPVATAEVLPPGLFTNRSEYSPGPPRNITAIIIDSLNSGLAEQMTVRDQLLNYLRDVEPGTRVAIFRSGETLQTLHAFTDDIESLRARLATTGAEAFTRAPEVALQIPVGSNSDGFQSMLSLAQAEMARMSAQFYEQLQEQRIALTLASLHDLG